MGYMDQLHFSGHIEPAPTGLFGLQRPRLPREGRSPLPPRRPLYMPRAADAPQQRLTADELVQVARDWRQSAREGDEDAAKVAEALEALAAYRKSMFEAPRRSRGVIHRISEFIGL